MLILHGKCDIKRTIILIALSKKFMSYIFNVVLFLDFQLHDNAFQFKYTFSE